MTARETFVTLVLQKKIGVARLPWGLGVSGGHQHGLWGQLGVGVPSPPHHPEHLAAQPWLPSWAGTSPRRPWALAGMPCLPHPPWGGGQVPALWGPLPPAGLREEEAPPEPTQHQDGTQRRMEEGRPQAPATQPVCLPVESQDTRGSCVSSAPWERGRGGLAGLPLARLPALGSGYCVRRQLPPQGRHPA